MVKLSSSQPVSLPESIWFQYLFIENYLPIKNTNIAIDNGPCVVDLPIQNGEIIQFATC